MLKGDSNSMPEDNLHYGHHQSGGKLKVGMGVRKESAARVDIELQSGSRGSGDDGDENIDRAISVDYYEENAPEKRASWMDISFLILADIVGTGVLALGSAVATVGWIPGVIMMIGFLALNVYAGVILKYAYAIVPASSYTKMAKFLFGKFWVIPVQFLYYSFLIGVIAQYVQVVGESIRSLLIYVNICNWEYVLIGVVILMPLAQVRTLAESAVLQKINTLSITLVILISVCYMWVHMDEQQVSTELFNTSSSWIEVFNAISKFTFGFMGNFIYLEFLAEMKVPHEFHKAFYVASPYQLIFYSLSAFTQYGYLGVDAATSGALIYSAIPVENPLYGACALLLLVHMLLAYLIKATIMARVLHTKVWSDTVNERSMKGNVHWFLCTLIVGMMSFLISSSIPSFSALMGFLGSFQCPLLGFFLPPLFVMVARKRAGLNMTNSWWEVGFFALLILIAVVFTGLGLVAASLTISQSFEDGESPFYC